jgi:hypothetical protein
LELEFRSTRRKISLLKISNRKYSAIFDPASAHHRRRPEPPNFQNGNSTPLACPEARRVLYRELRRAHPRKPFFTNHHSRGTNHEFLIHGSAIKNRRKALKT